MLRYLEGGAWVLIGKQRSKIEIYNDYNSNLTNLFLQIKYHPNAIIEELELMPVTRSNFFKIKDYKPVTEIQQAARFYYLIKNSFRSTGNSFAASVVNTPRINENRLELIHEVARRIDGVWIENLDWKEFIDKYDDKDLIFYLDPPYVSDLQYDLFGIPRFLEDDHLKLAASLREIKGDFILSYNDCEFIRDMYKGFKVVEIDVTNGLNNICRKELLIMSEGIGNPAPKNLFG